jgi:predicted enzyme related to lactoylglutathione lyase
VTSKVVHFQFGAHDADRLANFYQEVFGWRIRDARLTSVEHGVSGPYRIISADEAELSGGVTGEGSKGVILTVQVDDIAETLERAERLGGRRLPDVDAEQLELVGAGDADGRFALGSFVDPEGNTIQLLMR